MKAEDLVVNERGEGEVVEEVGEVFPDVCVSVLPKALIVETVDLGDLARFVVASEDCNTLGIADFESDK